MSTVNGTLNTRSVGDPVTCADESQLHVATDHIQGSVIDDDDDTRLEGLQLENEALLMVAAKGRMVRMITVLKSFGGFITATNNRVNTHF